MVCTKGTLGAPAAPWTIRQTMSSSSELAVPHSMVDSVNMVVDQIMMWRRPKRATGQPVIGMAMAVARMLNVIAHEISSGVAAKVPCICGRTVEATSIEVK